MVEEVAVPAFDLGQDQSVSRIKIDWNDGHVLGEDLLGALQKEYQENDLFPSTDVTEDWLKLTDFDPDNVIKLGPVRPRKPDAAPSRNSRQTWQRVQSAPRVKHVPTAHTSR